MQCGGVPCMQCHRLMVMCMWLVWGKMDWEMMKFFFAGEVNSELFEKNPDG